MNWRTWISCRLSMIVAVGLTLVAAGGETRPVRVLLTPIPWGQRSCNQEWAGTALFLKDWCAAAPDVALIDDGQAAAVLGQMLSAAWIRPEGSFFAAAKALLPIDLCLVVEAQKGGAAVTIWREGTPPQKFETDRRGLAGLLTDMFDWLTANVPAFDPAYAPFTRAFLAANAGFIANVYTAPHMISHWTSADVSTGDVRLDMIRPHLAFLGRYPQMRRAALHTIRGFDGDGRPARKGSEVFEVRELALLHSLGTSEEAEAIDVCAKRLKAKETGARLARWLDAFDPDAAVLGALANLDGPAAGDDLGVGDRRQEGAVAIFALEKPSAAQTAGAIRCLGAMGLADFGERIARVAAWEEPLARIAAADYFAAFPAPFGDDTLRRLAGDPAPAVAFAAVRALIARGGEDNRLLPLARRLFDAGVSNAVVTATLADLGTADDGARLRRAAAGDTAAVRSAAARGLLRLGLDLPEGWSTDPDEAVTRAALAVLPAARAAAHRQQLIALCNHPLSRLAEMARMAAVPLRPAEGEARDLFELETEHPYIRQRLVRQWGAAGDEAAARHLVAAAANANPDTRALAVIELARHRPAAARPLLAQALADAHRTVRLYGAAAAEACADAADLPLLKQALAGQPDAETRFYLEDAVARCEGRPPTVREPVHRVVADRCMTFSCVLRESSPWNGYYLLGLPSDRDLMRRKHAEGAVMLPRANKTAGVPKQVLLDPLEADRFWLGIDEEFDGLWDCIDGLVLGEESMSFSSLWDLGWRLFCRDLGIDPARVAGDQKRLDEREKRGWADWSMRMNIEGFNHMVDYIKLRYGKRRPGIQIATFTTGESGPNDYEHLWKFDISAHYAYGAPSRVRYLCIRRLRTTWPDRPMLWLNQGAVAVPIALNNAGVSYEMPVPSQPVHALASVSGADTLATWMAGGHNGLWSVYAFSPPGSGRGRGVSFIDVDAFFPDDEAFARAIDLCFSGVKEARIEKELLGDTPARPETSLEEKGAIPAALDGILGDDSTAAKKARAVAEVDAKRAAFRYGFMTERLLITEVFQRFSGLPFPNHPRDVLLVGPLRAPGFDIAGDCDYVGRFTNLEHMPLDGYRMIAFADNERAGLSDNGMRKLIAWLRATPGVLYIHRWLPDGPDAGRICAENPTGALNEVWPWKGDLSPLTAPPDNRGNVKIRAYQPVARVETLAGEGQEAVLALWRHPDYKGVVVFDAGVAGAVRLREALVGLRAKEGIGPKLAEQMGMTVDRDDLFGHVYFEEPLKQVPAGVDLPTGIRNPVVPPGRSSAFIPRDLSLRYLFARNGIAVVGIEPLQRAEAGGDGVTVVSDGLLRVVGDAPLVFEREGRPLPDVAEERLLPWTLESNEPGVARIQTKDQNGVSWLVRAPGGLTIRKK